MRSYIIRLAIAPELDMMTPSLEVFQDYDHTHTFVLAERPLYGTEYQLLVELLKEAGFGLEQRLF